MVPCGLSRWMHVFCVVRVFHLEVGRLYFVFKTTCGLWFVFILEVGNVVSV